jgi:hypothetical protein
LNSSFIEDDENDDDMSTCSEDSFLSAEEEHPKDTAKRIENLHFAMKQRENMRKKLILLLVMISIHVFRQNLELVLIQILVKSKYLVIMAVKN